MCVASGAFRVLEGGGILPTPTSRRPQNFQLKNWCAIGEVKIKGSWSGSNTKTCFSRTAKVAIKFLKAILSPNLVKTKGYFLGH